MKPEANRSGNRTVIGRPSAAAEPPQVPTHFRYLPTGETVRVVELTFDAAGRILCEFVSGERATLPPEKCEVIESIVEIAEYERTRSLWRSLSIFNPVQT